MSSGSVDFLGFEHLPSDGVFIVPGRLDHREILALASRLAPRPITWLIEENALVEPATPEYLSRQDVRAATFSEDDPDPAAVGQALRPKLADGGLLVFIPGDSATRFGTASHITSKQLRFLCALGLPTVPLAVSIPAESSLATNRSSPGPSAILSLGRRLDDQQVTVPNFQESLLEASEIAFSSRSFLQGSLAENLLAGLKKHGRSSTIFDGSDDSELPFSKLLGAAIAFSREVKAATGQKRVGIILPPGKAGLLANLAVLFANKIPVNLNFTAPKDAVESCIKQAGLEKFITADPFVRKVPHFPWPPTRDLVFIERILPTIKKRIVRWVVLSKLLPTRTLSHLIGLHKGGRGDDEAILLFTSGSSGEPKGVPLTHRNVLANVCQFGTRLALPPGARILGSLPLFHSFGCTVTLWFPIIEGIDLVTYPSPLETKRLAELIHQHRIYLLLATPTFLRGYMRRIDPEQLASLKLVVTGAEKLPVNLAHAFEKKFGKLPLEGYGLTETSPATNVNLPEAVPAKPETPVLPTQRLGSAGPFLPGIAVRITNPATEQPSSLDQSGIIWLKGANIFPGYLDRPDLTEGVLVDGWFKTNDVGRVDEDGFLYIEGRISRFSKIGGEMVPHEAVEGHLNKILGLDHDEERRIAVIGVPDEQKGEVIGLLSTLPDDMLEQKLIDIRYQLLDIGVPSLWCPKFIIPVREIPVLASGKLDIRACEKLVRKRARSRPAHLRGSNEQGAPTEEMWLNDHLESNQPIRFDRFMELALYDPADGYYSSRLTAIGERGDFSTSATLSGSLALAIAAWIRDQQAKHVIEIGPGTGQLARAILENVGAFGFARRAGWPVLNAAPFTYHLVERSPVLAAVQRRVLRRAVRWHHSVEDALQSAGGHALLFSNELVDAFPVRVFKRGGAFRQSLQDAETEALRPPNHPWEELHLRLENRQLVESFSPAQTLPDSSLFGHPWPDGQRIEIHQSYHQWLADWLPHWTSGQLLTIDYGGSGPEIYRRAPAGTLRAYYHHAVETGPALYSLPGRRDLTADVNFDDLQRWGTPLGLDTIFLTTQRDFLLAHLDPQNLSGADRFLTDPQGAGSAFKVLLQRKE